jgi:hypothetical protein
MRFSVLLPVIALPLLTVCQVMAQDSGAYDLIPGDAAAVVRLQAPDQTIDDLATFVDKVQPGFGGLIRGQATAIGMVISNPTLAGVDRSKDCYLILFADSNRPPETVVLVSSTDVASLKQAVGASFHYAEKDSWVAYSTKAGLIDQVRACFDERQSPVCDHMQDHVRSELNSGQLTVFVNSDSLKKTYAVQLAQAEDRLEQAIEVMAAQIRTGNSELDLEYVMDIYRRIGEVGIQTVRDSKSAVLSLHVTDKAVRIEEILTVHVDSQSDVFLKSQPVSDMLRLKSVPHGLSGYWAMSGDPKPFMDWAGDIIEASISEEEVKKKLLKSFTTMQEVRFGTIAAGGDIAEDDDVALRYFGLAEIEPASKVRDAFLEFGPAMEYEIAGIRQEMSFERDAEQIAGQTVDVYRFKQTIPPAMDPTGLQKALNDRLYGADGMTQRLAFKGDLLLQTMGGGQDSMKRLLTSANWSDAKLLQARERQHEKANVLFLVDVPTMTLKFAKLIIGTGNLPIPVQAEQLAPLQIAPSYVGFSMVAEPQTLRVRTTLPVETFQGFAQISMFVQGLMAAGR